LGKPLIGKVLRSVDERQFARAHELDLDWGTIERELIGIEHGEVARVVLDHWNLPLEVGEAVQFHHAPDRSEGMLAYGVALANSLAHRLVDPLCEHAPEALTAQAALGISDERLLRIEERLRVQLGDSVPPAATVGS
jgi:HD-like signal output (HDOD) protein